MENFTPITDKEILDDHNFSEAWYLDDKKIIIGKYHVLFGYRIRAGYEGQLCYEIDYCCGADPGHYVLLLSKVKEIIMNNPKEDRFKGLPEFSKIKPYFKDEEFLETIKTLSLK